MPRPVLAFVTTPLQVLCLREAVRQKSLRYRDVEMVGIFRRPRRAQSHEVCARLGIELSREFLRRRWASPRILHRVLDYHLYRQAVPLLRERERVFLGYFGDPDQWALALRAAAIGLVPEFLDDGSASIALRHRYETAGLDCGKSPTPTKFFVTGVEGTPSIRLFSFFPLSSVGALEVDTNELQTLREEVGGREADLCRGVVFVSQPLVELGLVPREDDLLDCIRGCLTLLPGLRRKIYLKHPSESRAGAQRRAIALGMELLSATLPVEALIAWDLRPPRFVLSLFSTALFSLSRIKLPSQRIIMALPRTEAVDARRAGILKDMFRLAYEHQDIELAGAVGEWLRWSEPTS